MKLIDYQDARPIYEQIAEGYKVLILKGVLAAGEQMPSVRSLAMELSTNPNTVQKAFSQLEREGFIYSVKGRGSFVSADKSLLDERVRMLAARMRDLLDQAGELGIGREELMKAADEVKSGSRRDFTVQKSSPEEISRIRRDEDSDSTEGGIDLP